MRNIIRVPPRPLILRSLGRHPFCGDVDLSPHRKLVAASCSVARGIVSNIGVNNRGPRCHGQATTFRREIRNGGMLEREQQEEL